MYWTWFYWYRPEYTGEVNYDPYSMPVTVPQTWYYRQVAQPQQYQIMWVQQPAQRYVARQAQPIQYVYANDWQWRNYKMTQRQLKSNIAKRNVKDNIGTIRQVAKKTKATNAKKAK